MIKYTAIFNFALTFLVFSGIISCGAEEKQQNSKSEEESVSHVKNDSMSRIKKNPETNEKLNSSEKKVALGEDEILKIAKKKAEINVQEKLKNASLDQIFSKNPSQLNSYKVYIETDISKRNYKVLLEGIESSITEIEKIIFDINAGQTKVVSIVPTSLTNLLNQLKQKKIDLNNFSSQL
jgi:hypothetical protein